MNVGKMPVKKNYLPCDGEQRMLSSCIPLHGPLKQVHQSMKIMCEVSSAGPVMWVMGSCVPSSAQPHLDRGV